MYYPIYISLLFWLVPHILTDVRCYDLYDEKQTHENRMALERCFSRMLPEVYARRGMLVCGSCDNFDRLFGYDDELCETYGLV